MIRSALEQNKGAAKYITLAFTDKGMSGTDTASAQTLFRFKTPQIASLIAVQHPDAPNRKIGIMLCHNPNGVQWHIFKYNCPREARDPLCDSFQRAIHWRLCHLGRRAQAKRAVERRSGNHYAAPTPPVRARSMSASTHGSHSIRGDGDSTRGGGGTDELQASDRFADAIGISGFDANRSWSIPKRRPRSARRRSERRHVQSISADASYVEPNSGNGDPVYSELSDDISLLGLVSSHQSSSNCSTAGAAAYHNLEDQPSFSSSSAAAADGRRGSAGAGAGAGAGADIYSCAGAVYDAGAAGPDVELEPKPREQLLGRPTTWRGASSFGAARGWGAPRANQ